MFKYGLYEFFKDEYSNLAGEEAAAKYKPIIWAAGSASAEVFADIALCPLEMTKVKIQTSPTGSFPIPMLQALRKMKELKAATRYPFGSLVPLWSRQVSPSAYMGRAGRRWYARPCFLRISGGLVIPRGASSRA